MFTCIALLAIYFITPLAIKALLAPLKLVFWLEAIAIMAFGVAWLVKGGLFFEDKTLPF
jgi:hypothetical protein